MTNTDKKITTNGGLIGCQPAPQGFPYNGFPFPYPQPQCVSPHVIPPQPFAAVFAQDVRVNKLKNFEISMTYHKEEFSRPLKPIDGKNNVPGNSLQDYFEKVGIINPSPVIKVKLLEMLKIDAALMKDGYYPFFIDCYNNNLASSFEEVRVVHEFCKYQSALVRKYETEEVSKVLNKRLEELLLGDSTASLNSLTMKRKKGLIFWMSNFVPRVNENKFLSKLFEFDESVSDYINVDSKENCEDTFDYFEHIIEVSDCVVRLIFLSETNLIISLEKTGEVLSRYNLEIQDYEIHVTREKLGD